MSIWCILINLPFHYYLRFFHHDQTAAWKIISWDLFSFIFSFIFWISWWPFKKDIRQKHGFLHTQPLFPKLCEWAKPPSSLLDVWRNLRNITLSYTKKETKVFLVKCKLPKQHQASIYMQQIQQNHKSLNFVLSLNIQSCL